MQGTAGEDSIRAAVAEGAGAGEAGGEVEEEGADTIKDTMGGEGEGEEEGTLVAVAGSGEYSGRSSVFNTIVTSTALEEDPRDQTRDHGTDCTVL